MNIGIISPYLEFPGGVECTSSMLKKVLTANGHFVDIVAGDKLPISAYDKLKSHLFGEPYIYSPYFQEKIENYDAVICNGEFGYGITHPKCINLFHGSAYGYRMAVRGNLGPRSFFYLYRTETYQKLAARGKRVVCVSEFLKNLYEKKGIQVDTVIENGVDIDLFQNVNPVTKSDKYLFVGSLDFYGKGFDILQCLADKGMEIDCVTQKKPCQNLGWHKQVNHNNMPEVYSQYKVFLFPSRFEGIGLAPLEAMACGLPVVMSPVGLGESLKKSIPEFVSESYHPQEYFDKAMLIEQNYEKFSKKAREYVENNHSLTKFSEQWNKLMVSLS